MHKQSISKLGSSWQPILQGKRAQYARAFINEIAASLKHTLSGTSTAVAQEQQRWFSSGVSGGDAGYALFYAYKHKLDSDDTDLQSCNHSLMLAAEALATYKSDTSLYGGLTGVAWIIQHAGKTLGKKKIQKFRELQELNRDIDDFLLKWLRKDVGEHNYDLVGGLVGIGVYFLERLPKRNAYRGLETIVRLLSQQAIVNDDGICWFTPPSLIPSSQIEQHPQGYYNLGLAHGIPGIIAFLSHAYSAGIVRSESERLLRGAVSWLLRQKLPDSASAVFAYTVSQTAQATSSRLAWCYGDAGIVAALCTAASSLDDNELHSAAMQIAHRAAHRLIANSGVVDAGICHGAFGLAHIFNRLYQATQEPQFLEAALRWFDHGWQMHQPDKGIADYLFYQMGGGGTQEWIPVPGLLMGLTGLGLVTLAGVTDYKPAWDRFLLLDISPLN